MFVGPANSGEFSNGVYDWQQTHVAGKGENFRGKKDPLVALQQFQAERGWQQWNAFNTAIGLELKARGLMSTRQKGAEDLQFVKQRYSEKLAASNQDWANARMSSGGGKAGAMIKSAMDFAGAHKEVRTRSDMAALQKYSAFRTAVKYVLASRTNKSLEYNPDLQYALDAYGRQLADKDIGFEAMWNRTLENDDLSDIKVPEEVTADAGS